LLLRGTAVGIVVATFIAGGAVGATAIRAKLDDVSANRAKAREASQRVASESVPADSIPAAVKADTTAAAPVAAAPPAAAVPQGTPRSEPPATASDTRTPLAPVLPMGQSTILDGVTVLRTDSNVVVSFDLSMVRTRRPDKFEQFVRTTLPLIYGSPARDALAKIPSGELASQGDLLTELPAKGMHISPGTDWIILLYPETKADSDGPLVVRYRVSVVPYGQ
jgi:hypothetical protein